MRLDDQVILFALTLVQTKGDLIVLSRTGATQEFRHGMIVEKNASQGGLNNSDLRLHIIGRVAKWHFFWQIRFGKYERSNKR